MIDSSDYTTESETTIAEAFRSPARSDKSLQNNGLRLRINADETLTVRRRMPRGFAAVWGLIFPNATVVELSGKINLTLRIYTSHLRIKNRRWFSSSSVVARFHIEIPLFDEIGDQPAHQLIVDSALAFLYPFEPMHVQVAIDEEVVFRQGKFARGAAD